MLFTRITIGAIVTAAALAATVSGATAFDESKYPDWGGQWHRPRGVATQWDQTKPSGLGQQAPLTPEYQARLVASMDDQAHGGQGLDNRYTCITNGEQNYFISGDGYLMPARKDQPPPDLRYFKRTGR